MTKQKPEAAEPNFKEWHAMSLIFPLVKKAVLSVEGKAVTVNSWAIAALTLGVDEVCDRLCASLDTFSLVSGLLIVATIAIVTAPTQTVIDVMKSGTEYIGANTFNILFTSAATLCLVTLFSTIILGCLFTQTLRVAARDADRWRIILQLHMFPTFIYTIFSIGNFAFGGLISLAILCFAGQMMSITIIVSVTVMCGVIPQILNVVMFLPVAHPNHGWLKHHPEEYKEIHFAFSRLEALAKYDQEMRSGNVAIRCC